VLYLYHFKNITLIKHVARINTESSWESLDSGGSWRPWNGMALAIIPTAQQQEISYYFAWLVLSLGLMYPCQGMTPSMSECCSIPK
jgi:hypothetical protein